MKSARAASQSSRDPTQNTVRGEEQAAWSNQYASLTNPSATARRVAGGAHSQPAPGCTANDERSGKVRSRACGASGWRRISVTARVAAPDDPQVAGRDRAAVIASARS